MNTYNKKPVAEINVVPFIDVMLVLLVIFMITTPLLTQGVNVELPSEKARAIDVDQAEPIVVTVDQQGDVFLNVSQTPRVAMQPKDLVTQVAAELVLDRERGKPRMVLVRGDKHVAYGNVVRMMALLQQAGVDKVGLMTKGEEESRA